MKNVFIIGSKGIPAKYGGFETFVDQLTQQSSNEEIKYFISCLSYKDNSEFVYNNSNCFNVKIPKLGSAAHVLYDILSLKRSLDIIKENKLENPIIYILACRIGPFLNLFSNSIKKLNVKIYINPDGHEWMRTKWNKIIRKYWKTSERLMVKRANLVICDSMEIESYILNEYKSFKPLTKYIAYGADVEESGISDDYEELVSWYDKHGIKPNEFYLIVGRFVSENNYELMIKEFMKSSTKKDLVIISNLEHNQYFETLQSMTKFEKDLRIKFVGTMYQQNILKKIREDAYAYIHGHEVGGTNPSLLEALSSTNINLLLNVKFNNEVGKEGALYFTKQLDSLKLLIEEVEKYNQKQVENLGLAAKCRIRENYSWTKIVNDYEELFLN